MLRSVHRRFCLLLLLVIPAVWWGVSSLHTARADEDLPESASVSGFVGHAQTYVLSCESRSAADLAGFWGISVSEREFLSLLPSSDNPELGFVGDPNGMWGSVPPNNYGVHAPPVAALLRAYGLDAEDQRGLSWDGLRREIASGRPVVVWVIGAMWDGVPRSYHAQDGSEVTVAAFEHSMVIVGYDATSVQAVDASTGWSQWYALEAFLRSWGVLGNMAVTVQGPIPAEDDSGNNEDQPPEPPTPTPAPTLTPLPTPNATQVARLLAERPVQIFFPQVYDLYEPPSFSEVCQVTHQGILKVDGYTAGLGLCIPPALNNPAGYLGCARLLPALP